MSKTKYDKPLTIDLAIFLGKQQSDNVGVIIETKRPSHIDKMFKDKKINVKALQELVLYYLKVSDNRKLFYSEIAEDFITNAPEDLPCIYFDIRDYKDATDKEVIDLQKILSPYFLLKKPTENDHNELDDQFYKELLHIIGLEEVNAGGKNIIHRKGTNPQSLIDNLREAGIKIIEEHTQ